MFVFAAGIRGHYHKLNLQIVLNTPKNPYLNQATQKNACQIFPPPKNSGIKNFKPQKLLLSSPLLEIWSTPGSTYWLICQGTSDGRVRLECQRICQTRVWQTCKLTYWSVVLVSMLTNNEPKYRLIGHRHSADTLLILG